MKPAAAFVQLILVGSFLCCALYFILSGAMFSLGGFIGWIVVSTLMTIIVTVALLPLILLVAFIGYLLGF